MGALMKSTGKSKGELTTALKHLKDAGRIHQAGTRRYARYGLTAAQAKQRAEAALKSTLTATKPRRTTAPAEQTA
jgi:DNA-binding transcriptional regulator PaaX